MKPLERRVLCATVKPIAVAGRPVTKVTAPITVVFAASTFSRDGVAVNVVRIRPRLYSLVTKSVPRVAMKSRPTNTPWKLIWTMSGLFSSGAMSPWPVRV